MNFRQFFSENHWWGKILGAFFGYLIGGSAGALLGILIGNFFDLGLSRHFSHPLWSYHSEKNKAVQSIFFEATFSIMGHIAKSDGRISQAEIQMASQLMNEMGLNSKQKQLAKQFFIQGKDFNYDTARILIALKKSCHNNPELLKLFMEIQYKAAQTDGLSKDKIQALDKMFRQLGFAPLKEQPRFHQDFTFNWSDSARSAYYHRTYHQNRSQSSSHQNHQNPHQQVSPLSQAFAVLQVDSTANKQEVKRAYRKLMSKNHPDKLIAQGLPESMIKLANDKTQKITKAYEQICTAKGW